MNKDELLAVIYKDGYDHKLIDNLYNIRQKIWDYQNKNIVQEIMDSDFDKIEEDIDSIVYTMHIVFTKMNSTTWKSMKINLEVFWIEKKKF